ncbi:hypothetical protein MNEG_10195 [Monoraphidium neglectum]|uniref:Uncharacterized protein n=1 Tax=Monoraphidium neglectum TaxID=145388 RepID=A0A0D2M9X1_9CHLO|nr:hypothetical protein MNEG_10195 [Monoraphidium neglectum]KIY97766.1 hypothetical protein MNEG_10195 [Monoraphidium neglectum]|eukprot:XP_013896786.1 hypothetical protein MNEG_10195 [Monoraphidium neglectum]
MLQEVAQWLPRADARRARLVCRAWRGALAGLATAAATPAEASTVTRWRAQLEAMVASLPCLRELTVGSRLSDVGAQQLAALAGVPQLRMLRIPHGHALRDRGVQTIAQLTQLRELQILGANALTGRALCALSMLGANLRVLDLRGCGKVSFAELRDAWLAVCSAYTAAAAARTHRARGASGDGGSGGGGGGACGHGGGILAGRPSLQQLLPGGAEVLQRQRTAGANRLARGGLCARDRLPAGAGRHGGRGSSGGGGRGRGRRVGSDSGSGGPVVRVFVRRRNSTGSSVLTRSPKGRGSSRSGAGSGQGSRDSSAGGVWQHGAAKGGGTAGDGASCGEGKPANAAAVHAAPSGADKLRVSRVAALKMGARLPRQLSGGAAATGAPLPQHGRLQGSIFKQPAHQQPAALTDLPAEAGGGGGGNAAAKQPTTFADAYATIVAKQATSVAALYAAAAGPGALPAPGALGRGLALGTARRGAGGAGAGVYKQSSTVQAALLALLRAEGRRSGGGAGRRGHSSGGGGAASRLAEAGGARASSCGGDEEGRGAGQGGSAPAHRARSSSGGGGAAALPMPFPHLHTLAFSCQDGGSGGASPAAELAAVAAICSLTNLEVARCQQVPGEALACLSSLTRLASLKLSGLWSAGDRGLEALAALRGLTALALHHPMRATGRGVAALAALSRLEALSLSVSQDLGHGAVARLALALPRLRALEVSCPGFGDACCEALAGDAAKRAALTSLKLHGAAALTARGLAALRAAPALAALALDACGGVASGGLLAQGALAPRLRSLALRRADFANMFAGGVLERPACAATLLQLDLSGCADLADRELRKVAGFLPNLEDLTLTGCPAVTDAGLSSLSCLRALRALSAGGTRAAGAFAEALAPLPGLTSLSLRGCGALTEAAVRLQLPLLAGLQVLDLSECRAATDVGVLALAGSLASLGLLNLQGCKGVTRQVLPFVPHWLRLLHSMG